MSRRTRAVLAGGVVAGTLLGGCTQEDGRAYPTDVDIQRATRMWTDPWVAPTASTTARPQGPAPGVSRVVAGRRYTTTADARAVVAGEVEAALSDGWSLTGALCEDDTRGFPGAVTAYLSRGGDDLDRAAAARVSAAATSGAGTASPSADGARPIEVVVSASVPHHLDTTWPTTPAVRPEQTCLGSGTSGAAPTQLPVSPMTGADGPGSATDLLPWPEGGMPSRLTAAIADAGRDEMLTSLGIGIATPDWTDGTDPRVLPTGAGSPRRGPASMLAGLVSDAEDAGWTLTYAACLGGPNPTLAELHRDLGDGISLALRLTQTPMAGSDEVTLVATATLASPTWWGPAPATLAPVAGPCWSAAESTGSAAATGRAVPAFEGTPWFGPTTVWPRQPGG